jgi:hypothetical protein
MLMTLKSKKMIEKMKENEIEKRISLDECIQIVSQSFTEIFGSIDPHFLEQPFLSDIESLRKQINETKGIEIKDTLSVSQKILPSSEIIDSRDSFTLTLSSEDD